MHDVRLTADGLDYGGWKTLRLARGIEQLAGTFELGVTDLWPGQQLVKNIAPGDSCTVSIDGTVVITGYVDDVNVEHSATSHEVTVSGRDATGDLVDCSAICKTGQFSRKKANAIIAEICKPFGISVSSDVGAASAVIDVTQLALQGGETAHEILDRVAKLKALLLMSDGQGGLLITAPGNGGRVGTALMRGDNIKSGGVQFSFKERFSKYIVKGQGQNNDLLWGEATRLKAETSDAGVSRYRPLIVIAEDLVDGAALKRRAAWEANVRAGKSAQLSYKVHGWTHGVGTDAALWQPNTIVHVTDPWCRTDADLLVKNVLFTLDESGSITTLALTPQQAFSLIPMPKKPADTWDLLSKQQTEINKLKRDAEKAQK